MLIKKILIQFNSYPILICYNLHASIVTAVAIGKRDFSVEPPRMGLRRATEVTMQSGNGTPMVF